MACHGQRTCKGLRAVVDHVELHVGRDAQQVVAVRDKLRASSSTPCISSAMDLGTAVCESALFRLLHMVPLS